MTFLLFLVVALIGLGSIVEGAIYLMPPSWVRTIDRWMFS